MSRIASFDRHGRPCDMTMAQAAPILERHVRVAKLRAYRVRIPLRKPIAHASHSRSESDNVIIACELTDGTVGYGEGVPRDYVTGEDIETSLELLRQTDWSALLDDWRQDESIVELSRRLELPRPPEDDRGCIGNAARCAAEMALLDAKARQKRVSLSQLIAECPEYSEILEPRSFCRYSGVITSKPSLRREIVSAFKMRFAWFRQVKVKVGTAGQDDARRLKWFRRILGPRVDLRVDANEAWSPSEAAARIGELAPYRISSVEQPLRHEDFDALPDLRRVVRTPIMLDESLCSRIDAQRAIAAGACDLFNIRLSKCGGLVPSLDLALLAHRAGLGYQLGCQIGETGILSAAGRHFACSVRGLRYIEGSYDQYLVKERLTRQNVSFEWRGIAPALSGAGLGVDVDPYRLQSVTTWEATLYG